MIDNGLQTRASTNLVWSSLCETYKREKLNDQWERKKRKKRRQRNRRSGAKIEPQGDHSAVWKGQRKNLQCSRLFKPDTSISTLRYLLLDTISDIYRCFDVEIIIDVSIEEILQVLIFSIIHIEISMLLSRESISTLRYLLLESYQWYLQILWYGKLP